MKNVDSIQRQGQLKDVRASAAASGLPIEEIETTVALIQALRRAGKSGATLQAATQNHPPYLGSPSQSGGDSRVIIATPGPVARPKIPFPPGLRWTRGISPEPQALQEFSHSAALALPANSVLVFAR